MTVLSMTLAGSIPVLSFLFIKMIYGSRLNARFYIWILRLGAICYLLPLQLFKYFFHGAFFFRSETLEKLLRLLSQKLFGSYYISILNPARPTTYLYIQKPIFYIGIVWIVLAGIMLVCRFHKYPAVKSSLTEGSAELTATKKYFEKSPDNISRYFHKKKIKIYVSDRVSCPCTAGCLRPYILVPPKRYSQKETEWLLRHETIHILHKDVFWKCLCVLACVIHWYNPIAYVLLCQYNVFCEYYCDEECMEDRSEAEKKGYAIFLVESAVEGTQKWLPVYPLSKGGEKMNKRINWLFYKKEKKTLLSLLIILCTCFLSSLSVFAYALPESGSDPIKEKTSIIYGGEDTGCYDNTAETWVISDGEEDGYLDESFDEYENLDFSESNILFIGDDGTMIPIYENDGVQARAKCKHNYVSGKTYKHIALKNGGCKVIVYRVNICTKCKATKNKTEESTYTSKKCPHTKK